MGVLRFSYGTMSSGKSTLALQIHHNLSSRQLKGLLLTKLDRDGSQITSRLGVSAPAVEVVPTLDLFELAGRYAPLSFMVCDETQFYSVEQCDQLARVVDELGVDVYAFGLITDFRGLLFEGTKRLLEIADERVALQVEALHFGLGHVEPSLGAGEIGLEVCDALPDFGLLGCGRSLDFVGEMELNQLPESLHGTLTGNGGCRDDSTAPRTAAGLRRAPDRVACCAWTRSSTVRAAGS